MSLQFFNWMAVLNHADLSFAQPFTALSYVSVGFISALFLGETVDKQQIMGIACVIGGVWFISRTDHVTQRSGEGVPLSVESAPSQTSATGELIQREGVCGDC
jgi:drug/metabolite transporter (DMT)-like permease